MEQFIEQFIAHEDLFIFIILAILTINSIIIVNIVHKNSKRTDAMYEFIRNLIEKKDSLIK